MVHFGVTRSTSDEWVAQQLREATPFGQAPRFLIRNGDSKYGECLTRVAVGTAIEVLKTPYRTPKANAICERWLGSVRRECLDHILVVGEKTKNQSSCDWLVGQVALALTSRAEDGIRRLGRGAPADLLLGKYNRPRLPGACQRFKLRHLLRIYTEEAKQHGECRLLYPHAMQMAVDRAQDAGVGVIPAKRGKYCWKLKGVRAARRTDSLENPGHCSC